MFKPGGCAYVFFVYGMYNQFNVVAGPEGTANAVLIRSLEPVSGLETMMRRRKCENPANLTTGPGKLCQALAVTRRVEQQRKHRLDQSRQRRLSFCCPSADRN